MSDKKQSSQDGIGRDHKDEIMRFIPEEILSLYDLYSYRHAAAILSSSHPDELSEVLNALLNFHLTKEMLLKSGGNESEIPKMFNSLLRPQGWFETKIHGNLIVVQEVKKPDSTPVKYEFTRENFIDGHKIDYVKREVAFDLEWNSKDQTFDRDLYAMRTFYECGLISAGILVTRSEKLNPVFSELGIKAKYGASTTWTGKLIPRLDTGRNGGCPILVFAITDKLIIDQKD